MKIIRFTFSGSNSVILIFVPYYNGVSSKRKEFALVGANSFLEEFTCI